jgi:hypothetical protein
VFVKRGFLYALESAVVSAAAVGSVELIRYVLDFNNVMILKGSPYSLHQQDYNEALYNAVINERNRSSHNAIKRDPC